jgi:hypothetical protein
VIQLRRRRPADQLEAVVAEREQDDVSDHAAVGAARHEVLSPIARVSVEAVDGELREQPERVRALHGQVVHVVREVEEDAGLLPRSLLVAPVREFRRHAGIHVRARLRVAKQLHRASGRRQHVFEAPRTHVSPFYRRSGSIRLGHGVHVQLRRHPCLHETGFLTILAATAQGARR